VRLGIMGLWAPVAGCLWIGSADHAERKASVAIELGEVSLLPDVWSACTPQSAALTVSATVSASSPELPFQGWLETEGRRVQLGEQPALQGEVAFSFLPAELLPLCPEGCSLPLRVGVSRVGLEQGREVELEVLAEQTPALREVRLQSSDSADWSLATVPRSPDPAHGVPVAQWPSLVVELSDPHLRAGIGGSVEVWACPEGLQPPDALCVIQPAEPSLEDTLSGDLAFRTDTRPLGEATCAAIQEGRWPAETGGSLYAVVTGHTCGSAPPILLTPEPARLVTEDCDADGSPSPEDCADTDPLRYPGQADTPYDGIDSDCSGGSDFDLDGDGAEHPEDCDDTDPVTFPGALEVCDGRDNDCLTDGEPPGATLYSTTGTTNHTDLQQALTLAEEGDTVTVCPGTYTGPFTAGAIVLRGAGEVILQSGAGSVLTLGDTLQPAGVASVQGLVLQGGQGTDGGGLNALGVDELVVEDCTLSGNDAARGGGLAVRGLATVRRTTLEGNTATEGGGLWAERGAELGLEQVTVADNTAGLRGGGLFVEDALVEADPDTLVEGNTAGQEGGGLWATGELELTGGSWRSNEAPYGGAMALVREVGSPEWWLDELVIEDQAGPGIVDGAGIWAQGSAASLVLLDAVLARNVASGRGGGLYAEAPGEPIEVTLVEVELDSNVAADGGGLAANNAVVGAGLGTWSGNAATRGGALWVTGTAVVLGVPGYGTTLSGNTASAEGGGLWLGPSEYTSALLAYEAVISDNEAGDGGGIYLETGEHELVDCTLSQNSGGTAGGLLVLGQAQLTLSGSTLVSGNLPNGGRLVDDWIEACSGVTIDDPLENSTLDTQGTLTSCFLLTSSGPTSPCGC
jgi:hypothetical protein